MEEINYKEKDRQSILDYIVKKKQVSVSDIIENAGADKLRVYPILFELEQEGKIGVVEVSNFGAPKVVKAL